jgi:hypothetical protein
MERKIMLVTAILRVVMRIVDATANANQLRAQRMLDQHLARVGNKPGQGRSSSVAV